MRRPRAIVAVLAASLMGAILPALPAGADSISNKQREAAQLADRIEALGQQAEALGEDYNGALAELEQAKADTAAAQQQLDQMEADLGGLRESMSGFAVKAYVYADQTSGIAGLLSGQSLVDGAAQREGYSALALGVNMDLAGDLRAQVQDLDYQRAVLRKKVAKREALAKTVAQKKAAAENGQAKAEALLATVKGELADLVRQEEERRAAAAAIEARAAIAAAQARLASQRQAAARASSASGSSSGSAGTSSSDGGNDVTAAAQPVRSAAAPTSESSSSASSRPGRSVPPPSSGAGAAVAAALSQLGVPYHFASADPGDAFDCSGLTSWAWGRAGVYLPHQSRSQYAMLTKVDLGDIQPGDLVFFHSPISHVGLYVGNGMMVHAPRSGDVVKLSPLRGSVVGVGRPG